MPDNSTMNWSAFPPQTQQVQFDEKWAFVAKKQKHCDPDGPVDQRCGDHWDHVALDPGHKLVVSLVPGERTHKTVYGLVRDFHRRTGGRLMPLMTSDEYKPYREAILQVYGETYPRRCKHRIGRKPKPGRRPPPGLLYATVHKHRRGGRVVRVSTERYNGTDRHQNSRKVRRTYRFSKDWDIHQAATYFSAYSYNFCWSVRTLRRQTADGVSDPPCTPAMSAGLADHIWTLQEWITLPAVPRSST